MKTVLIYGDSNSHGTMPMNVAGESRRYAPGVPWPDVMAAALGSDVRVITEGLPGRTTVHEDTVEGGARNGIAVLPAVLHSHKPIDLLLVMLGTNDLKPRFSVTANEIARSLERIVRQARIEGTCGPEVLIAPTPVRETGTLVQVFAGAQTRQQGLTGQIEAAAGRLGCGFVDAGEHVSVSDQDGVHWEAGAHAVFGAAMARVVAGQLARVGG